MDYPNTGKEARALGAKKYFTGKPCKFGHIAERRAHNGQCIECGDIAVKKYRQTEQGKETSRQYYRKIRVKIPERIMLQSAKSRARSRNVPCTITEQDILDVWPENSICPVLGVKMKQNNDGTRAHSDISPSLDCLKPDLGYVTGNIAIISMKANLIKNKETDPQVFRQIAEWLEK